MSFAKVRTVSFEPAIGDLPRFGSLSSTAFGTVMMSQWHLSASMMLNTSRVDAHNDMVPFFERQIFAVLAMIGIGSIPESARRPANTEMMFFVSGANCATAPRTWLMVKIAVTLSWMPCAESFLMSGSVGVPFVSIIGIFTNTFFPR